MKRRIIAMLLVICLFTALSPSVTAIAPTFEDSIDADQLVAHLTKLYLNLEGHYDTVVSKDSNALSIGFMQWHGVRALTLMKQICEAAPEQSFDTLGYELYNEIVLTPTWSSENGSGWKNRVLTDEEAAVIQTLIGSEVGIACQNQLGRKEILDEAKHGWNRGVRTEAALIYYAAAENQYGVGNIVYFMQYVREAMGITENDTINSLEDFHNAVLKASETHSSIRNYLKGRKKVYNFITQTLQLASEPEPNVTPFVDIPVRGHWARAAVEWAYQHEPPITSGTSAITFSPDATLTRAEAVTFLWAASGKPEPSIKKNPFEDVSKRDYFYKAVLWAAENGITSGTTPTTFSPAAEVMREDMLTFLWAAFGRESTNDVKNPFSDVHPKQYCYQAVIWAVANGVLVGNENSDDPTLLCPKTRCTRAYVVTYLYNLFHV